MGSKGPNSRPLMRSTGNRCFAVGQKACGTNGHRCRQSQDTAEGVGPGRALANRACIKSPAPKPITLHLNYIAPDVFGLAWTGPRSLKLCMVPLTLRFRV